MQTEWFINWFDTCYYHLLYKNRDAVEAQQFIDSIINATNLPLNDKLWDLGCGKGRHSIYLNQKGFVVTGTDLSVNNITHAKVHENAHLEFYVHDMRTPFRINYYDMVLNLFTSFGYFDSIKDNLAVFKNVHLSLKKQGLFLIDFFNANKIINNLVAQETKEIDGVQFNITKTYNGSHILKNIHVVDGDKSFDFQEKVEALHLEHFENLAKKTNFKLKSIHGDYDLSAYEKDNSNRLILLFEKL